MGGGYNIYNRLDSRDGMLDRRPHSRASSATQLWCAGSKEPFRNVICSASGHRIRENDFCLWLAAFVDMICCLWRSDHGGIGTCSVFSSLSQYMHLGCRVIHCVVFIYVYMYVL